MKLTIEVELQPDEIPLATELLSVLRTFTNQIKPKNAPLIYRQLLARLEDQTQMDSAIVDIMTFWKQHPESTDELFDAFCDTVFNPELLNRSPSILPFFVLFARNADHFPHPFRDRLTSKVFNLLIIKRPLHCDRREFYAYAEAFAALVKLEWVTLSGVPENRSAAITMLGKTVELCANLLIEKCDPNAIAELYKAVTGITDEVFQYDIGYIYQNMGWKVPSFHPTVSTATTPTVSALVATSSLVGHTDTIFSLCYDDIRDQVISSGREGMIITWNKEGKIREKFSLPKHYACSMDMNPRLKSLFICGVAKEPGKDPAIIGYVLNDKGNWSYRGSLEREGIKLVSCVKALTGDQSNLFVTGESGKNPAERSKVRIYDAGNVTAMDKLQPLTSYEEHEDIITSLAYYANSEGIFYSGSRDCSIRTWDKRQNSSVAQFGMRQPATNRYAAHDAMVTCLDVFENTLISGGLDKKIAVWDIRRPETSIAKFSLDDTSILKISVGPTMNYACVSTMKGFYLVDLLTNKPKTVVPFKEPEKKFNRYHDMKWSPNKGILYAAGDDKRVDQFVVRWG